MIAASYRCMVLVRIDETDAAAGSAVMTVHETVPVRHSQHIWNIKDSQRLHPSIGLDDCVSKTSCGATARIGSSDNDPE